MAVSRGSIEYGDPVTYQIDGQAQSDAFLFGNALIWSYAPWRTTSPPLAPGTGTIVEVDLRSGARRVVYTAGVPNAGVSVKVSGQWLTWEELPDRFSLREMRLYAMSRNGGTPILVDQVTDHPNLAGPVHWCVDGSDIYWTLALRSASGQLTGMLLHRRLPNGPSETLVQTPADGLILTPAAADGVLAWTQVLPGGTSVVNYRLPDGSIHDVGVSSFAPAVGAGFVAFSGKGGTVWARTLSTLQNLEYTVGAEPRASGEFVAWGSTTRDPVQPDERMPVFLAHPRTGCVARFQPPQAKPGEESIPLISDGRAVWVRYDTGSDLLRLTVVVQPVSLRC